MKIESHLEKILRLNDVHHRLNPIEDFELWFWSAMVAGTSAVNAALHFAKITPAEDAFPSQPGVYLVKGISDREYRPVLRALGDILHVGRPPIQAPVPHDIEEMMKAMEEFEHFRDPCVRGEMMIDEHVVERCKQAYLKCLHNFEKTLGVKVL